LLLEAPVQFGCMLLRLTVGVALRSSGVRIVIFMREGKAALAMCSNKQETGTVEAQSPITQ
ncbi:MAG: hypothetical protein DMG17_30225, partial [Acidobacteria bacterium]